MYKLLQLCYTSSYFKTPINICKPPTSFNEASNPANTTYAILSQIISKSIIWIKIWNMHQYIIIKNMVRWAICFFSRSNALSIFSCYSCFLFSVETSSPSLHSHFSISICFRLSSNLQSFATTSSKQENHHHAASSARQGSQALLTLQFICILYSL